MISIIIPFYNEEDNINNLYQSLKKELKKIDTEYELIFVDDASTDKGADLVEQIRAGDRQVILISSRTHSGKGAMLKNGFANSRGDIIVFMDADFQNDPVDLPNFLEKLKTHDFVNGWRKKRDDDFSKTFPSTLGNKLLKIILNSRLNDINCGFKAMRRSVLTQINLYGDNFRFLAVMAEKSGFKICEIEIVHHSRKYGVSKYGFLKRFSIFADILTAYFIIRFSQKPLHFFGLIGGSLLIVGSVISLYLSYERLFRNVLLYRRPALLFAVLLIIVGIQIIMTGIVAELIVYLNQRKEK